MLDLWSVAVRIGRLSDHIVKLAYQVLHVNCLGEKISVQDLRLLAFAARANTALFCVEEVHVVNEARLAVAAVATEVVSSLPVQCLDCTLGFA